MGFAIESQGGTCPLSLQAVHDTLALAASSNQQSVQVGTEQLKNWEKQGMYHSFLQVSFANLGHLRITPLTLFKRLGCLSRPLRPTRSPLPCNHSVEKWH